MNSKITDIKKTIYEGNAIPKANRKGLRIVYSEIEFASNYVYLPVTPKALVHLDSISKYCYLKPVDFISPQDIRNIQRWAVETVLSMDFEWNKYGNILPLFIKSIGTDLCILLETLKTADYILEKIWNTNNFSHICIELDKKIEANMLQFEYPGYQYTALLNDNLWSNSKRIKIIKSQTINNNLKYTNKNVFAPPIWKKIVKYFLSIFRVSVKLKISLFSIFFIKFGLKKAPIPSLFVVPNKDTSQILQYHNSIILNDYLAVLPKNQKQIDALEVEIINSLESWFSKNTPVMENIFLFKNVVIERLVDFIRARKDLLRDYIKIKNINTIHTLKLILPSAIGCAPDAWCSMAIQEKGGIDASGQHGGGHNSFFPYSVFGESRFSFNFTYGDVSPTYAFLEKYGKAKLIKSGSPTLFSIHEKCNAPPQKTEKILYIMNLCVPFYSANFPWEFVVKQFNVLELLNLYSDKFSIDVKEEHTGTVKRSSYPGLTFIKGSPKDVIHEYDLLIVESGQSTAVLEAAVTNKFIVAYTGAEWEDLSKESLEMLSKRAECYDTFEEFLVGLKKTLSDPQAFLDASKLTSTEFKDTYCNPVSSARYIETIKRTLELS